MKLTPAGLETLAQERETTAVDDRLLAIYMEWLDKRAPLWASDAYKLARKMLTGIKTTPAHAHSLLINPQAQQHPRYECSGIFLSALYETTPDQTITYDLNTQTVRCIGYQTRKTVINNGRTGDGLGCGSSGVIINNGTTRNSLGAASTGVIINNDTTGDNVGWSSSSIIINNGRTGEDCGQYASGLIIALTEPQKWGCTDDATILRPRNLSPALKDYVYRLVTASKERPDTITQEFGSAHEIKDEIYRLRQPWQHWINTRLRKVLR